MPSIFDLKLTEGGLVVDPGIYSLESDGLNARSVPRQIIDAEFGTTRAFYVDDDITYRFTTGFVFEVILGAYEGTYTVDAPGATTEIVEGRTVTRIPIVEPITASGFDVSAVTTGLNGIWKVVGAVNGNHIFYPGAIFTISGNAGVGVDGPYTVQSSSVSGSAGIVGVTPGLNGTWRLSGDHTTFFEVGVAFKVHGTASGDGSFTVQSSVFGGGETSVVVNETIPATPDVAQGFATPVPAITRIVVTGTIPATATVSGVAIPPDVSSYTFSSPPTMLTSLGNSLWSIIWHITGNHASKFTVGAPIVIKGNDQHTYTGMTVTAVADNGGNTDITATFKWTGTPIAPDATGVLLHPSPAVPIGYASYPGGAPSTQLKLMGKGVPYFNDEQSWGHALQENLVHMTEHFKTTDGTPPVAPLSGTLWYDAAVPALQLFGSTVYDIKEIDAPNNMLIVDGDITGDMTNEFEPQPKFPVGGVVVLYGNGGLEYTSYRFEIAVITYNGGLNQTEIEVVPNVESLNGIGDLDDLFADVQGVLLGNEVVPNTGSVYSFEEWHGVMIAGMPVQGNIDMNGFDIHMHDDSDIIFDGVGSVGEILFAATTTGGITFEAGSTGDIVMQSGNDISLTGGDINMNSDSNMNFTASSTGGIIFNASSSGDITMAANNDINMTDGDIRQNAGSLIIYPSGASGGLQFQSGATAGINFQATSSGAITMAGSGNITFTGTGDLTLTTANNDLSLNGGDATFNSDSNLIFPTGTSGGIQFNGTASGSIAFGASSTGSITMAGTGHITVSGATARIRTADGSAASPGFGYSAEIATGFYRRASAIVTYSGNGTARFEFDGDATPEFKIHSAGSLGWTATDAAAASDLTVARDAADTLAMRRSTNPQEFKIYNTFTNTTNYERLALRGGATASTILTEQLGTGTARSLILGTVGSAVVRLRTGNTDRWDIGTAGHLTAVADNTYDFGAAGATRPRTGYFGTSVISPALYAPIVGTNTAANLNLQTNSTTRWTIDTNGHLIAGVDATYDIGASGATRPRTGYFSQSVVTPVLASNGASNLSFTTSGGTQLEVVHTAAVTRRVTVTGSAAGAPVIGTTAGPLLLQPATPATDKVLGTQTPILVAVGDETTPLTIGNAKVTFRMPFAMTVTAVRASLTTAQAAGNLVEVMINEGGAPILSTPITIDNTQLTSTTATTPPVISDTALADDAEITIDITDADGATAAAGLKVYIIGYVVG